MNNSQDSDNKNNKEDNLMEDDFSLFDPLQPSAPTPSQSSAEHNIENVEEKQKDVGNTDKSVVLEDLLGGLSEKVTVDENKASDQSGAIRSTTSFFLLDFDNDSVDVNPAAAIPPVVNVTSDHKANNIDDIIDEGDDSLSSVVSEVLSVNGSNLPINDNVEDVDSEPQSGFFFNDLLVNDTPRNTTNNIQKPKISDTYLTTAESKTTQNTPSFKIGSEVLNNDLVAITAKDDDEEENLESLLDIKIPEPAKQNDDIKDEISQPMSFFTEVENFAINEDIYDGVDGKNITEMAEYPEDVMDTTDNEDDSLEKQLRPVFEMCQPNAEGLISIEHLKKMCTENGQNADHVLNKIDPEGLGLLSFSSFCKGVAAAAALEDTDTNHINHLDEDKESLRNVSGGMMPGYTGMPGRETSHSPGSADSAIGADSSASPELRHEIDFADETGEETFTSFGENHGAEYESDMTDLNSQSPDTIDGRGLVRRNSWLRTSLRRTSPNTDSLVPPKRWGSFRTPRQPRSTAALASALYNSGPATSGSFNSSGRSSNCDDGDIHSDISIEEDVLELNSKVRQLQDQVSILSENQAVNDERYSRVKADNVTLTAKIHVLEENIREIEMRGEERLVEEQRRNRDIIQRLEREKQLEIENYTIRLQGLEKDHRLLSEEVNSLRSQLDKARAEKENVEEQLTETQMMLQQEQREHKILAQSRAREMEQWTDEREKSLHVVEEMSREVEQLKSQKAELTRKNSSLSSANGDGDDVFGDLPARIAEAEAEIRVLREQNKRYKESTEELQAALVSKSLEEGRTLLNNTNDRSLAAEFDAMSENEMRKALQDQQDVNLHLRKYIDSVLLNIMEKYPELLEVRGK